MIELKQLQENVRNLVSEVAEFIREEGETFDFEKVELKGFNDLVSYVDKEAEKRLVNGLMQIFPQAGFIAEEGTKNIRDERYNWIIDPLDGTTNFTHGLPVFSISIALMDQDKVILGVVHEINREECFYAIKDGSAYCNDRKIYVSKVKNLNACLLATGFPYYNFEKTQPYLKILDSFMQKTHGIRRLGSAAVDLAYVACGRFEGFFEYNLNVWDVAAGAFIVQQAGGKVSDFSGGKDFLFGREIVAANACHMPMLDVIKENWNKNKNL